MEKPESEDINNVDLLHPELLSFDLLKVIISKKYAKVNDMQDLSREKLLDMFYKIVMPLPQRQYKVNRKGILLTAKRIARSMEKSSLLPPTSTQADCKTTSEVSPPVSRIADSPSRLKPPPVSNLLDSQSRLKPPPISHLLDSHSRLKPPPSDVISSKKIKLTKSNDYPKLPPPKRTNSDGSDSGRKIIRLNSSSKPKIESHEKPFERNGGISEESIALKKKHKPITWP